MAVPNVTTDYNHPGTIVGTPALPRVGIILPTPTQTKLPEDATAGSNPRDLSNAGPTSLAQAAATITNVLNQQLSNIPAGSQISETDFRTNVAGALAGQGWTQQQISQVTGYLAMHQYGGSSGVIGEGGGIKSNLPQFFSNDLNWGEQIANAVTLGKVVQPPAAKSPAPKLTPLPTKQSPESTSSSSSGKTQTSDGGVTGVTGATQNPDGTYSVSPGSGAAVVQGLLNGLNNSGVPGSGSIANALPVAGSDTTTSSGPNSTLVIGAVIAVVVVIGIYFYMKHKKKGGKENAPTVPA